MVLKPLLPGDLSEKDLLDLRGTDLDFFFFLVLELLVLPRPASSPFPPPVPLLELPLSTPPLFRNSCEVRLCPNESSRKASTDCPFELRWGLSVADVSLPL